MKILFVMFSFFIPVTLFAQIDINHIEEYKKLIYSVQTEHKNSIGAAFIVGKNESHYFLATAKHVINGSQNAVLTSIDGTQYEASLVAAHDVHDLALLQTPFFPLKVDKVPIVTDIAMNDEVGFVSVKDQGKVIPSRGAGIVRDVTDESLSLIMGGVELGHSGSPLLSKDGIAGIIVKNGRFIECINIMLVKEIMDEWGEGLFEGWLVKQKFNRERLSQPGNTLNNSEETVSIKGIEGDGNCRTDLMHLIDGYLNTSWSCSGMSGDLNMVRLEFYKTAFITKLEIYISDKALKELPYGNIHVSGNDGNDVVSFDPVLEGKRRQSNGYWYIYRFSQPILGIEVAFGLTYKGSEASTSTFNEIQLYGIPL
jgi:hypothetical protein